MFFLKHCYINIKKIKECSKKQVDLLLFFFFNFHDGIYEYFHLITS